MRQWVLTGLVPGLLTLYSAMAVAAEPPPPFVPQMSMLAIEAQRDDGELRYLQRLTVQPLVVASPRSKTGWTLNIDQRSTDPNKKNMAYLLSASAGTDSRLIRDELGAKFVELERVCGPNGKVSVMTTPAPEAPGSNGQIAKHIQFLKVKGCTENGIMKPDGYDQTDCFVDRSDTKTLGWVEDSCCFYYRDLNHFLDQCTAEVRAYKQKRGLLPKGFRYQPLTEEQWTEEQYQYWQAGQNAADPVAHWRAALKRWPLYDTSAFGDPTRPIGFTRYLKAELRRIAIQRVRDGSLAEAAMAFRSAANSEGQPGREDRDYLSSLLVSADRSGLKAYFQRTEPKDGNQSISLRYGSCDRAMTDALKDADSQRSGFPAPAAKAIEAASRLVDLVCNGPFTPNEDLLP
ncbi:MAG: hypothetical protein EPN60_17235 [Nevskiaceae bacterium]|nr:MAG: hypothetical protein EPO48_11070 [Nevskiaceae bacterium]TAM22256.1 MAG: hypothetical protein EPN60_17235 [Nevskiaceae bacterium]